jgi:hypothetical protein
MRLGGERAAQDEMMRCERCLVMVVRVVAVCDEGGVGLRIMAA